MTSSTAITFKADTFFPMWVYLRSRYLNFPFCSLPVKSTKRLSVWALVFFVFLYSIANKTGQTVSLETVQEGFIPRLTSLPWIVTRNTTCALRFLSWCCSCPIILKGLLKSFPSVRNLFLHQLVKSFKAMAACLIFTSFLCFFVCLFFAFIFASGFSWEIATRRLEEIWRQTFLLMD